jgi:hypothetical protein
MGTARPAALLLVALSACFASQPPDDRLEQAYAAQNQDHTPERLQAAAAAENKADRERLQQARAAASAPLAPATPTASDYMYWCPAATTSGPVTPEDQAACHRCLDEGMADTKPPPPGTRRGGVAFMACRHRMEAERVEQRAIVAKIAIWQPRGYQDAGEGLEGLSDAELDAVPADSRTAIARLSEIQTELAQAPIPQEKRDIAWNEIQGFVAKEKACRADPKCMGVRTARKAEEAFFASVVQPMCSADQGREAAIADMARERANPSGFVDKKLLHDRGADLQGSLEQLAALMPAYVKVRHHPWPGWHAECHVEQ